MTTEINSFVASVFLASTEGREPMTEEDANYTIEAWREEGIEFPEGLDGKTYSELWNELCEEA